MDVNQEFKFFGKFKKKKIGGGGGGRVHGGSGLGGQDGCERRIEVFVKIKKKIYFFLGGGSGWGVMVDVNEELKFLCKFKKKNLGGGWVVGGGGGRWGGRGWVGGSEWM